MANKITFANGQITEYIDVSDHEYHQVKQLLAQRPLLEILNELEAGLAGAKQQVNARLKDIEARHAGSIRDAQQAVNQARQDLLQADNVLREAVSRGRYADAPAIEAKKVELQQAILSAEVRLAGAQAAQVEDRATYLNGLASGNPGSGAAVGGVNFKEIINITRAILFEIANNGNMAVDIADFTSQQAKEAADQAHYARYEVKDAQARLDKYRQDAQARYSGGSVAQQANSANPQPANDNEANFRRAWNVKAAPKPAQPAPAAARQPGDWGEVTLGRSWRGR